MRHFALPVVVAAYALSLPAIARAVEAWPSFLGPSTAELSPEDVPLKWSPDGVAWKAELPGYGQSSPVVWDAQAYVTSTSGANKETCHVTAWSVADGKPLWKHKMRAASEQESSNYVSRAAPTPVADAAGVIAFFEGGSLVALDHEGGVRWERDLINDFGPITSRHGLGSSLAQNDEVVFVWVEREKEPYILALNKRDGSERWKVEGLGATSWSSPVLAPNGGEHLVFSASGMLVGLDPATGKRLWKLEGLSGNTVPTPRPLGEGKLLLGAAVPQGEAGATSAAPFNGIVQISQGDDGTHSTSRTWGAKRATSSFGSPLAHQGFAYFINRTGVLYCLDLATGKEHYAERLAESAWATPLGVGDRVYCFGRSGTITVVQAGDTFKKLAESRVWSDDVKPSTSPAAGGPRPAGGQGAGPPVITGPILYGIAATPGALLLRSGEALYCVRP